MKNSRLPATKDAGQCDPASSRVEADVNISARPNDVIASAMTIHAEKYFC